MGIRLLTSYLKKNGCQVHHTASVPDCPLKIKTDDSMDSIVNEMSNLSFKQSSIKNESPSQESFMKKNVACITSTLRILDSPMHTYLIVDAYSLVYLVHETVDSGNYTLDLAVRYGEVFNQIIGIWRKFGFEPILVWDGASPELKADTAEERYMDSFVETIEEDERIEELNGKIEGCVDIHHSIESSRAYIKDVYQIQCLSEADQCIAGLAITFNAFITSNDSDLIMMGCYSKGCIPIDSWSFFKDGKVNSFSHNLFFRLYEPLNVLKILDISLNEIAIFCTINVNDFISKEESDLILGKGRDRFKVASKAATSFYSRTKNPFKLPTDLHFSPTKRSMPRYLRKRLDDCIKLYHPLITEHFILLGIGSYLIQTMANPFVRRYVKFPKRIRRVREIPFINRIPLKALHFVQDFSSEEPGLKLYSRFETGNEDISQISTSYLSIPIYELLIMLNNSFHEGLKISITYRNKKDLLEETFDLTEKVARLRKLFNISFKVYEDADNLKKLIDDRWDVTETSTDNEEFCASWKSGIYQINTPDIVKLSVLAKYFNLDKSLFLKLIELPKEVHLSALVIQAVLGSRLNNFNEIRFILLAKMLTHDDILQFQDHFTNRCHKRKELEKYILVNGHRFGEIFSSLQYVRKISIILDIQSYIHNATAILIFFTEYAVGNKEAIEEYIITKIDKDVAATITSYSEAAYNLFQK